MKGHIRQRSENAWQITVDIGRDETGRRHQHVETVHGSKRLAQKRLAELVLDIEQGGYTRPARISFGEWLLEWHRTYAVARCNRRTADSYLEEIQRHLKPALGMVRLDRLSPRHLQDFYAYCLRDGRTDGRGGLSARTVTYFHRIVSKSLKDAVRAGYLGRNVAEAVDPPRYQRKMMKTMALKDVPRFLKAALATPFHRLFYAALYTGMREGELLGLPWRAVNLDEGYISVFQQLFKRYGVIALEDVKTSYSRRRITLSASLVRVLRSHRIEAEANAILLGRELGPEDLVFSYPDGRPLDPSTVTHAFARVLREAGLPHIRFHDIRHTNATFLIGAGVNIKVVSERLGHASVAFTMDTYAHVMPGMQESAAEQLDRLVLPEISGVENVVKMLSNGCQNVVKEGDFESEPHRNRTCNLLIKSQLLCQLS